MYFVDPENISVLYGDAVAARPAPAALYQEVAAPAEYLQSTKKWIPNVYLFDPKFYRTPDAEFNPKTNDAAKEDLKSFIDGVKQHLLAKNARLGIIALNDCARFAFALMRLLKYSDIVGGIAAFQAHTCANAALLAAPVVADTFLLKYDGGSYHGITVVARGNADTFVGLEAHASKLRKRPDFHLYQNMTDFVNTNFPLAELATGRVQAIPHTAGAGIIPTYGLTVEEMGAAWAHLEFLAKGSDAKTIFKLLQAPEDPSVTTYVPAVTRY